jgi:hypothetical protein
MQPATVVPPQLLPLGRYHTTYGSRETIVHAARRHRRLSLSFDLSFDAFMILYFTYGVVASVVIAHVQIGLLGGA